MNTDLPKHIEVYQRVCKKILLIGCLSLSFSLSNLQAQSQTVGLFYNDSSAYNGYTLFAPTSSQFTYLIDNCGQLIQSWFSEFRPGQVAYLLSSGQLLRSGRTSGYFNGGGLGGQIELYEWDGSLTWTYQYAELDYHQHHDIEWLPNGHVLLIAWERKSNAEALTAGRDPALLVDDLWPEHIVEVEPVGLDSGTIMWEWHLWDHMVQDYDSSLLNYGRVSDHPELMDLNYVTSPFGGSNADWIHANSIDYNPELDLILLNSRHLNEYWVIDHSTTTTEAASHSGGQSGMGGDILYRWGNPRTYQRGSLADQQLFGQHDAHWIPSSYPDGGKIMVYNNGAGRPGGTYSSVDIIDFPIDSMGQFPLDSGAAYGPLFSTSTYTDFSPDTLFSVNISGASRLPNGNILLCDGPKGRFTEVNVVEKKVWEYINPIGSFGATNQGTNPIGNRVFRAYRYEPDFSAFAGRDLTPSNPLEVNPLPSDCIIYDGTDTMTTDLFDGTSFHVDVHPNPVQDILSLSYPKLPSLHIQIRSLDGKELFNGQFKHQEVQIFTKDWPKGIYLLIFQDERIGYLETRKIMKN